MIDIDKLTERAAEALWQADQLRRAPWAEVSDETADKWRSLARAVLDAVGFGEMVKALDWAHAYTMLIAKGINVKAIKDQTLISNFDNAEANLDTLSDMTARTITKLDAALAKVKGE